MTGSCNTVRSWRAHSLWKDSCREDGGAGGGGDGSGGCGDGGEPAALVRAIGAALPARRPDMIVDIGFHREFPHSDTKSLPLLLDQEGKAAPIQRKAQADAMAAI